MDGPNLLGGYSLTTTHGRTTAIASIDSSQLELGHDDEPVVSVCATGCSYNSHIILV